ncbi:acetylxylan esterase [Roseisolibacter agri]|uniref:Cephalosporin deacetylase n=1 Tax=Roseisolibacter agri TaxID=2014610 RepID=A0AA37VD76_9BACT|nr:acetylxylan esterase [Roseisolibacter agri]GLC28558.1 cephalosporin deacetylase [Roseisolibacter agri]
MRPRLLVALALALPAAARAQVPAPPAGADTSVHLVVTLDRPDWKYALGDTARFRVSLVRAGRPIPGARVRVDLARERMPAMRRDTVDLSSGAATLRGALPEPGFLRATASIRLDSVTYTAMATAGFAPERLRPTTPMPADFEAFWRKAVADARRTPLAPVMTRLPERSTPEVDVYHVSFQNQRVGSRLYGMLSVPTKPGRYPAMLVVPGAGVRPYFPSVATARRGVVHLAIGIHGIPVDRDSLLYNELRATALQNYMRAGIEDRDLYYYKRVLVGVVRAGDFLMSLPQVDSTRYVVQGGSQGGALAIMAGVLDPRVKAIASSYPAMSDHFGYLHGRAGGWPHVFQDTVGMKAKPEKMETLKYYDTVNFARLLRVPGIYAWGYNDTTVPPTSSYAVYNVITAPKQVIIVPETGHYRVPAQSDPMDAWLLERLGVHAP